MKTKRKLVPKSVVGDESRDVGNSNVPLNTNVMMPVLLSPVEDVGSSKRRCIHDPTNLGSSSVVVGNLNGAGQSLPLNTNADAFGHQTVGQVVGGSKRKKQIFRSDTSKKDHDNIGRMTGDDNVMLFFEGW
ncbi:hypothetical protein Tco_1001303 [Tanacetum coccineum]